jgi:hypothetical protein
VTADCFTLDLMADAENDIHKLTRAMQGAAVRTVQSANTATSVPKATP